MSLTTTALFEPRLDWKTLHRYRPGAGLGYEKRAWVPEGFERVEGLALRHRWRELPDGTERRMTDLCLPADAPLPSRLALGGPGAVTLVAGLLEASGGYLLRPLRRIDGPDGALEACRALTTDPTAELVAAGAEPHSVERNRALRDLASADPARFVRGLSRFRWLATAVASATHPVGGLALYGRADLFDEVARLAAHIGIELRTAPDGGPQAAPLRLPEWSELPIDTGAARVDASGFNLAVVPPEGQAEELVLDDTAVIDLEPLRGWRSLTSLSLRRLAPRSLAPIPTARLSRLVIDGSDGPRLGDLEGSDALRSLVVEHGERRDLADLGGFPSLRSLDLDLSRLGSLDGLEALPRLEHLGLHAGELPPRLDALASLPALRSLSVRCAGGFDARSLPDLPALARLEVSGLRGRGIRLESPEALARFTALEALSLTATDVADLRWLAALLRLRTLDLEATEVRECGVVARLPALERLVLRAAPIDDLGPVAALPGLIALDVADVPGLDGFDPLALAARELQELDLGRLPLDTLEPLVRLDRLVSLVAHGASSLRGVDQLPGLAVLRAGGAQDLSALAGHGALRRLFVQSEAVTDLAPLASIPTLCELMLVRARIADLAPLAGSAGLTQLDLSHAEVPDLGPLCALPLQVLRLGHARFGDPAPLGSLLELRQLDVGGSTLRTLAPLAGLRRLRELRASWLGTDLEATALTILPPLARLEVSRESVRGMEGEILRRHHTVLVGE